MAASTCSSSLTSQRVRRRLDAQLGHLGDRLAALRSSLRAQMDTDAPACATPLASPSPIPVFPPVTTTTRPADRQHAPPRPAVTALLQRAAQGRSALGGELRVDLVSQEILLDLAAGRVGSCVDQLEPFGDFCLATRCSPRNR